MTKILLAGFIAAQITTAASAADFADAARVESTRTGAFAGVRLRVSLDGQPRERVRAGLALAPTLHVGREDGSERLRIGEGLEFGLSDRRPAHLSIAGRPLQELVREGERGDGRRANLSTIGWVAIGAVVVAVGYLAWFAHEMNSCAPHDDEC